VKDVLIVRHSRPSDGVVPVGAPRRQPLTVQKDVVAELVPRDNDHPVVEYNPDLKDTKQCMCACQSQTS